MQKIRIVQCPKCGKHQATAAATVSCKYCQKSTKIIGKGGMARVKIKAVSQNALEAAQIVRRLNEQ